MWPPRSRWPSLFQSGWRNSLAFAGHQSVAASAAGGDTPSFGWTGTQPKDGRTNAVKRRGPTLRQLSNRTGDTRMYDNILSWHPGTRPAVSGLRWTGSGYTPRGAHAGRGVRSLRRRQRTLPLVRSTADRTARQVRGKSYTNWPTRSPPRSAQGGRLYAGITSPRQPRSDPTTLQVAAGPRLLRADNLRPPNRRRRRRSARHGRSRAPRVAGLQRC